MRIRIDIRDAAVVVEPRGRALHTGNGTSKLWPVLKGLLESGVRRVVLDLRSVRSLDGGSLEELLRWGRRFQGAGAELHATEPHLHSAAYAAQLRTGLPVFPDLDVALEHFRGAGEEPRGRSPEPLPVAI
jgi:hypothetical protein